MNNRCFDSISRGLVRAFVLAAILLPCVVRGEVVQVGAGGYLTTRPQPCKALPDEIYRTADLKGATLTSQWWSALVWQPYSQPMFSHPMVLQCKEGGLTVGYPGSKITSNKSGIFGSGAGVDFTIGHSRVQTFPRADCGGFSDWFVTSVFASGASSLRTSFGHGSPYVFCRVTGGDVTLAFTGVPRVWSGADGGPVLGVSINGHHYGLFGASGSSWRGLDDRKLVNSANGKDYLSVALLPDNRPETLALFRECAYNFVDDTRVEFEVSGGAVKVTYRFILKLMEGAGSDTIFALYPHQWKYSKSDLTDMTYGSVRGLMKVGRGPSFSIEVPIQGVLPMLPAQGIADRQRMIGYLREEASKRNSGFGDTYWEGKHLGKLATLSGIAEALDESELRKQFVDEIKRRLEEWFTAREGKDQPVFYYDANWGTLIGSRPSYGSDRPLNDHHFHYGYFIRAAAEVARMDIDWAWKWGPMVELLIRDIASTDRSDSMFPFLRCFDKYAGHSWASGDANFGDGNNQESSSESMNAWYGMTLWGQIMGNKSIRDTGLYLFNTERTAVEEYWFDVSGTNFPKDFPNVALGMVWGGKGAFGTWFSGDIDCIHGINWLPFTPASLYMGRHPDYVKKNHDRIISVRKGGRDYNTGWGDLVCMFNALQDPATAAAYFDAHPDCRIESGNTHAFMYHWICTLNNVGLNDPDVTADYPLATVFNKDGRRTYVAYNTGGEPLTVTFSNGVEVVAVPGQLTTYPPRQATPAKPAEVEIKDEKSPDLGPNVLIFDPAQTDVQERVDAVFAEQERAQFGSGRYALLFKPGRYSVNVEVGFYTHIMGLGQVPGDVVIEGGVRTDAAWMNRNATCNFWRTVENIAVEPKRDRGAMMWAVSQAAPMRRTHIRGDLHLSSGGWSSGGFLSDCKVDGRVAPGSQQQWFSRNCQWEQWDGGNWNMVFAGCVNPPSGQWPRRPFTVVDKTPVVREKPYLFIDKNGQWFARVPPVQREGTAGLTWKDGKAIGQAISLEKFHIVKPDKDTAGSINAALKAGKNLLFTPGIYFVDDTIVVSRDDTVVLGIGLPSLVPTSGKVPVQIEAEKGVVLSGIVFDASEPQVEVLLQIGVPGRHAGDPENPICVHDIFCRVGGSRAGKAKYMVKVYNNNVVADNLWLWRADHGRSVGWSQNQCDTGLLVEGDDVTVYGLFVEHTQAHQTVWNGNGGRVIFYQSEMPYDPPSQEQWSDEKGRGFASYKVGDNVTTHEACGLGVYHVFRGGVVIAENAIETPEGPGIKMQHMVTFRLGGGKPGSGIRYVINGRGDSVIEGQKATVD